MASIECRYSDRSKIREIMLGSFFDFCLSSQKQYRIKIHAMPHMQENSRNIGAQFLPSPAPMT